MSEPTPAQLEAAGLVSVNTYQDVMEAAKNGYPPRKFLDEKFPPISQAFVSKNWQTPIDGPPTPPEPVPVPTPSPAPTPSPTPAPPSPPTPVAGPSGFAHPSVPVGMVETVWQDFEGDSLSALGITAGAGRNDEGALWAPWHVTVADSVATINGYPDTTLEGQWNVTSQDLSAVNDWVSGQFGIDSPLIGTASAVRILVAMRADSLPGLTTLALVTGKTGEGDFVEINAPLQLNAGTIHWSSWTEQEYAQETDDLTQWGIRGIQWGVTAGQIDLLKQTTPTDPLTIWKSFELPASWAQDMYVALQQQTNDAIYGSGTPNFPAVDASVTAENPIRQQHDWVQICTAS